MDARKLAGVIITDHEYPLLVVPRLLTKIVLHKTIESMLQRGEKIHDLVKQSEGLSTSPKAFYTQVCPGSGGLEDEYWQVVKANKQHSCCVLMEDAQMACDALIGITEYFGCSFGSGRLVRNLYR